MSLANKSFKNNLTGEIVTVIDSFENIAILENRDKINVNILTNPALYTEEIDPNTFFNNQGAYNILAEKIKNIPMEQIVDDSGELNVSGVERIDIPRTEEESIISVISEDDEKAALAAKYGIVTTPVDSLQKQNEAFAKILGEEAEDELPRIPEVPKYNIPIQENNIQRVEVTRESLVEYREVEDPIIKMFKGVKRIVEFNITLDIANKIPRTDFIEMMEDSYETSIIDFLADEFTNDILENPNIIRDMIKSKIKLLVYGEQDKKNEENIEITPTRDGSDPVVTETVKRTRKPRVKKEVAK